MRHPGLYIHIPFCRSKCSYCGFYSIASSGLIPRWIEALKKEASLYKGQFDLFDSLYLGGGTPSLLSLAHIEEILSCLSDSFRFAGDCERTLEANPGDISSEMITGLKSLGFNRINLGVQSFEDIRLKFLGRNHRAGDAENALTALRSAGFDNIGIDLIYGLEGQSLKEWMETLNRALLFEPEHLSCYQLTIEKKTVFWRMKKEGIIETLSEEEERRFFMATSDFLEARGYTHYEISNFSRGEETRSRHNGKYWSQAPYLGLGPSAHSFRDSRRWWNCNSVRKYCGDLEQGGNPVKGFEDLTEEQKKLEAISLGFRTREGFKISDLPDCPVAAPAVTRLRESGHIDVFEDRIVPTKEGFLVADRLPLCFFD